MENLFSGDPNNLWQAGLFKMKLMMLMSKKPVNLAVRFLLELTAIFCFGKWGYSLPESKGISILTAIAMAVLFALLWGIFAVRNDPSRSGKTVVQTPGLIRLILELALFGAAAWMLVDMGFNIPAWILGGVVVVHYALSWDRIAWLIKQK